MQTWGCPAFKDMEPPYLQIGKCLQSAGCLFTLLPKVRVGHMNGLIVEADATESLPSRAGG